MYRACVRVCVCVWELGTGELAATQADTARTIPYSAATLIQRESASLVLCAKLRIALRFHCATGILESLPDRI